MKNTSAGLSKTLEIGFMVMLAAVLIMLPEMAFAGTTFTPAANPVGAGLCEVADDFQGQIAAGIATIAVCTVGALACLGRVQWTTAVVIATGIAVLFGASALVSTISGASGC